MTKKELYKNIAKASGFDLDDVKEIFAITEQVIFDELSSATLKKPTKINLMDGLMIKSVFIPKHEMNNPWRKKEEICLDGKSDDKILVDDKLKVSAHVTKWYKNKINNF
ncbi:MAG: hypothetical protein ACLTBR_03380 [Anaerostipes sp.]|uniref:hypothetical protein n=1 Tax=Anaerostipes sp. TaxID=1872530 RepID=UPI0039948FB0